MLSQQFLIRTCWRLYYVYLMSPPIWLLACASEARAQRLRKVPHAWEHVRVRLFALYASLDIIRSLDLCFATDAQLTDGICRSVWGSQLLWLRALAWWARDMIMLMGLAYFLDFSLSWLHAALGQQAPRQRLLRLKLAVAAVMAEMSFCAVQLLLSNRFAWMFALVLGVVGLNMVSGTVAWQVLSLLPRVSSSGSNCMAPLIWEARLASKSILGLAALVLGVFLPLCFTRLLDGALGWSLIPSLPQGSWIGHTQFPVMETMGKEAPEVMPNPAVEAVELCIGWSFCLGILASKGCDLERPASGYIPAVDLGRSLAQAGHRD